MVIEMLTAVRVYELADLKFIVRSLGKEFVFYDFSFTGKRMTVYFFDRGILYYTTIGLEEEEEEKITSSREIFKILMDRLQKTFGFSVRLIPAILLATSGIMASSSILDFDPTKKENKEE